MSASPRQYALAELLSSPTSALSAPLISSLDEVSTLSSGGSCSMSAAAALLMSIATLLSLAGLVQAASAAAVRIRVSLCASRIGEARHWVALGAHQLLPLKLERLKLGPRLTLASKGKITADRVRTDLDVRCWNSTRLVELKVRWADDQQAFGVAA